MVDISVIIPVHNGAEWIAKCMKSIADQTIFNTKAKIEIVVFNDGSTDCTQKLLEEWKEYFSCQGTLFIITGSSLSKGVGGAKNGAVNRSTGQYLCFQDIDDVMNPHRILQQWEAAKLNKSAIIGCQVIRDPQNSTPRFVKWANNIKPEQLTKQIYLSYGPTILMPTWFCHRSVFEKIGGFDESGRGTPEDLIFFYAHIDIGGKLIRLNQELLIYTYHKNATTFSVTRNRIQEIQLNRLESVVLPRWKYFTVWNAGKAGRRFVRMLSHKNKKKVTAFCDVDVNKIGRTIELYCHMERRVIKKLPVLHFTEAKPPFVICVKLDMTNGDFEKNLESLNLTEGIDYILFS
ncbi:UDP-GlcNAc:betaGal beta-1,3-N-acetylglucosaminyltransferase-like protein 1 [Aricia agestis]|uniref:UDP-GlcNAc:betaGal beta-1,3-N-acetylglucosaminyltransferase-like protein 1 n=1 Tax=Aricia agestis TaxID=91739 RepID=UPI001C2043AE|nr:UDP-GlcNAc:betaGal beta-1,3-N-acetylglucosaminyltransferase-like protein 1 [Aricia agestis]